MRDDVKTETLGNGRVIKYQTVGEYGEKKILLDDRNPVVMDFLCGEKGLGDLISSLPDKHERSVVDSWMMNLLGPLVRLFNDATKKKSVIGIGTDRSDAEGYMAMIDFLVWKSERKKFFSRVNLHLKALWSDEMRLSALDEITSGICVHCGAVTDSCRCMKSEV